MKRREGTVWVEKNQLKVGFEIQRGVGGIWRCWQVEE
jgi:hypothetical protein